MENILSKIRSIKLCLMAHPDNEENSEFADRISDMEEIESELKPHVCKEFECELKTMLDNIPQNRPLYKDSGLWQVRTDDMEDVIFEQGVNESFFDFIKKVYQKENSFMSAFKD